MDNQEEHELNLIRTRNNGLITRLKKKDSKIKLLESELEKFRLTINNMSAEIGKIRRREKRLQNK